MMKDVAMMFYIKCSKYPKEELTNDFCDILFEEVIDECIAMGTINRSMEELTE